MMRALANRAVMAATIVGAVFGFCLAYLLISIYHTDGEYVALRRQPDAADAADAAAAADHRYFLKFLFVNLICLNLVNFLLNFLLQGAPSVNQRLVNTKTCTQVS